MSTKAQAGRAGRRRERLVPIFAVLALSLGVLGAEVIVRAWAAVGGKAGEELTRQDPYRPLFVPFGRFGYRQNPGRTQTYGNGAQANWNEAGYRGPVVSPSKPDGVFRIVLLGGSTTHGFGVEDPETIDAHMRRVAAERWPGRPIEVVNLALGGYDSYQVRERLRVDGLAYAPDLVVINSGINDVRNAQHQDITLADPRTLLWEFEMQRLREEAERGRPTVRAMLRHYFYLARLPDFARSRLRPPPTELPPKPVYPDAQDYFESNLREAVRIAAEAGADVLLSTPASSLLTPMYAPESTSNNGYWLRDAAETQRYRDALAERVEAIAANASTAKRPVTYVRAVLPPEQFLDDCHLTSEGNAAVAQIWWDAIEAYPSMRRFAGLPARPTSDTASRGSE